MERTKNILFQKNKKLYTCIETSQGTFMAMNIVKSFTQTRATPGAYTSSVINGLCQIFWI